MNITSELWTKFKKLWHVPELTAQEEAQRLGLVTNAATLILISAILAASVILFTGSIQSNITSFILNDGVVALSCLISLWWARKGKTDIAGTIIVATIIILITLNGVIFGFIAFFPMGYLLVIVFGALLLGSQGALLYGVINLLSIFVILLVEYAIRSPLWRDWLVFISDALITALASSLLAGLMYLATRHFEQTILFSHQAEADIQRINMSLERLVDERTAELKFTTHTLQMLMDNSPIPILIKAGSDWKYSMANKQFEVFKGVKREQIVNHSDYDLYSPEVAREIRISDEAVLLTKGPVKIEIDLPDGSGIYHTFISTKFPIEDEENGFRGIGEISVDITERKQAEAAIQKQSRQLAALHKTTVDLLNHSRPDEILSNLLNQMLTLLDIDHANIDLLEQVDEIVTYNVTPGQPFKKGDRVKRGEGGWLTWQAVDTGQPAVLADYSAWENRRDLLKDFPYHAVAQIPMIRDNKVIGVLGISRTKPNYPFSESDIHTANQLAEVATLILDNAQVSELAQRELAEHQRAETALRESEERFRLITWATMHAVRDWDLRTNRVWWGGGLQKTFQHSIINDQRDINEWLSLVHPEDRAKVEISIQQAIESGMEFWSKEYRFQRVDGAYADIFDRAYILRDQTGKAYRMVGAMMDITERKYIEDRLHESETRFREIFNAAPDAMIMVDANGKILQSNIQTKKLLGYTSEELLGQAIEIIIPERFHQDHIRERNSFTLNPTVRSMGIGMELLALCKDGSEIPVEVALSHHNIGGEFVVLSAIRDITERKQTAERLTKLNIELDQRVIERTSDLQTANSFLKGMLSTALIINSSLDQNQILDYILRQSRVLIPCRAVNIMLINGEDAYVARRIGYEGMDQIERDLLEFSYPLTWPSFNYMLSTGKSILIPDTTIDSRWQNAKSSGWARSYIGVPLKAGDRIIGFLNASHNEPDFFTPEHLIILQGLTDQAATAIQNSRLLTEVKTALEREQILRTQLVQADKLAALGKMVAVISHEINNPIQTIKNTFFLLEDQISSDSPSSNYLKIAQTEIGRVADLVARLRDTYRPQPNLLESVDLIALLDDVRNIISPQLVKSHIVWVQTESSRSYTIFGVRNNLKQVFLNLCLNAVEAMESQGEGQIVVNVHLSSDSSRVGVAIYNSGPTISMDALPHIFDPFFTTKSDGTGLGLSISYDIIQRHNGEITVENARNVGVTFTVWLPLPL